MAVNSPTASQASYAVEQHDEPNYIAVFIYLTILTAAELGVYAAHLPKTFMVGALVALALTKAVLVAMYFMHLAMERKGLWVIAATPLVIIAFCYLMLRPDLSARHWASTDEHVVVGQKEEPNAVLPNMPQGDTRGGADQQQTPPP